MKNLRKNLKHMAMMFACFAACMMLAMTGCKKDDKKDDNGGGGGGGGVTLTGIKFEDANVTLEKGETTTLKLIPIPSNADLPDCTFTSSKESVATVSSSGKVTAKAEGETTITAKTTDGKFSAKCTVTVTDGGGGVIAQGYAGPLEWIIQNNTLTISGNGAMPDYNITYNLTPWYIYGDKFTSVVIQNGATTIGDYAFYECRNFRNITIPNSVNKIGDGAFRNSHALLSINIPSSVVLIGQWVFNGCSALSSINVDNGNVSYSSDNGVLYDKSKTTLKRCPEGKTGGYQIPNSVQTIDYYAFSNCQGLTSVNIPNGVKRIETWAFEYCILLTSITLPSSITYIGSWAFRQCRSISTVTALMTDLNNVGWNSDMFEGFNLSSCTLKVPAGSIEEYKQRSPWKDFGTIIGI